MTLNSDQSLHNASAIGFAYESIKPKFNLDKQVVSQSPVFDTLTSMTDEVDSVSHSQALELGEPTIGSSQIDPVKPLKDPQLTSYYIQAAQHNHRAFLTTNLSSLETSQVTTLSSTWLIGRSRNCAIVVHDRSVSRCHAVIGYDVQQGFYLMDVGSSNGTYMNQKRLSVLKRYSLMDGDVILLCNLQFEFFIAD